MGSPSKQSAGMVLSAMLAVSAVAASAQEQGLPEAAPGAAGAITVDGVPPADLTGLERGPDVTGIISARDATRIQVTGTDDASTIVSISESTEVRGRGGFLGLNRRALDRTSLLNGLPVTVETVQWGDRLVASRVRLRNTDLQTATMIRQGTAQGFAEQSAATAALRGRVANIDQYNVRRTAEVYFDTARWNLSPQAEAELCSLATEAQATDNALLLVVGYADSQGDEDYNQTLSEKRASRVVNHLQQACGWKPYRMLTPTGMSEADPLADNSTPEGRQQNRRVAVNILVSKGLDGL
ncbi:MAG: OmpA family protein [Sphingomonadales bacterium]|nr:OmpA family protein [Sphingomonadales bacterium]